MYVCVDWWDLLLLIGIICQRQQIRYEYVDILTNYFYVFVSSFTDLILLVFFNNSSIFIFTVSRCKKNMAKLPLKTNHYKTKVIILSNRISGHEKVYNTSTSDEKEEIN